MSEVGAVCRRSDQVDVVCAMERYGRQMQTSRNQCSSSQQEVEANRQGRTVFGEATQPLRDDSGF